METKKMTTLNGGSSRKYSYRVYKAITEYWHVTFDDYAMDIIDDLTNDEVLADFLAWEGIIGYTDVILSIVKA